MIPDDLTTMMMTWQSYVELLLVVVCGGLAWWGHRWAVRSIGGPIEPAAPFSTRVVITRIVSATALPLVWVSALFGLNLLLRLFMQTAGLLDVIVPSLWFLVMFQLAAVSISLLLPSRLFLRFLIQLAVAIGIIMLAVRFFGRYMELMAMADYPLLTMGPAAISVSVILKSLFLVVVMFLIAGQVTTFLQNRVISRTDIDPALSFAMLRFLKFFLFGIGLLIVLDTTGVNLSTLTVFGGALGIGLGFGLQTIANNLVSGMILLLDRSIKQGDVITVGDSYGWVVKLGARYIVVRTRDGVERLIPNANLIASEITNWSHSDRAVRLHVKAGVSYGADPFRVRDVLLEVANTHPRVLKYPKPNVLFVEFGESSMDFELRIWINDPQEGVESVRSAMRFEIWKTFKEHGIEIPFPQRDLHIKTSTASVRPRELGTVELEESLRQSGDS